MPAGSGTQALLGSASELLSAMTHFVGVVSVPKREQFAFRHIDFVPLDGQRVLAIVVFADNDVQNRIIQTAPRLRRRANWSASPTTSTSTSPAARWRRSAPRCVHELRAARSEMETLLAHTVELAEQALAPGDGDDVVLAGQTRLMGVQDLSDLDRLRDLFEAFARKREILQLLERTIRAPGVRIFIGEETGLAPLEGGLAGHRALRRRRPGARRAGRDRAHPDGLRAGDPGGAGRGRTCSARPWSPSPREALKAGRSGPNTLARGRRRLPRMDAGSNDQRTDGRHATGRRRGADLQDNESRLGRPRSKPSSGELEQLRAEQLRERADLDNQRKRLARDVDMARKFANERLLCELLPLFDSMEAGLAAAEKADPLREGLELTLRQLHRIAEDNGLVEVAPAAGDSFDPDATRP